MAQTIELPQVGESVVEGTIGKWLKQPGDPIARYEPLVEVVTDKVTMEIPSPVDGALLKILAAEGETVPMGAPIAEVATAGGVAAAAVSAAAAAAPAAYLPETPPANPPTPATPPAVAAAAEPPTPAAGRIGYLNTAATMVGPTGGGAGDTAAPETPPMPAAAEPPARQSAADAAAAAAAGPSDPAAELAAPNTPRLSPAVRRLAREHSIDLSRIAGTGIGGRITRDDVLQYLESAAAAPAAITETAAATESADAEETYVALTPVRRMIAAAMVRSVSQIPHAWSATEVDVTNLVAARNALRPAFQQREGIALTYLPFVLRALTAALRDNPTFNAAWGEDHIILKRRLNIGLAVAAPTGLVVPVIPDADRLSLSGLAHAVADLTRRARQGQLTLADVQGGTFTLNNTGALGSTVSRPIINHPQAAILTTEAIQKRPVVINDAIAIRSMMNLCLSFDHRINDGAEAGAFIQSIKTRLEALNPDAALS